MRRIVWPGGSALGKKEEKNIGERSELGGSLGPFLLPSPLFSLPRSPKYIFFTVSACFLYFSSTAEPGPRLRIVAGKMRRSF